MNRDDLLARATDRSAHWDVLVIGGGATGRGTALDAASRGYRTLLFERGDFAGATSSRSTKLIHGGVRYLRQGNIALVRDSLRERGLLLQNAPHLVRPLAFIVPDYSWFDALFYNVGLKFYGLLAGTQALSMPRHLSRRKTLELLPTLNPHGLRGGELYHDAQFDDARLAIALAHTVAERGGVPLNYVRVTGLRKRDSRVCGARVVDEETGAEHEVDARVVINATGVFADAVRQLDDAQSPNLLAPSQGAHLVIARSFLPGESALMIPRTRDGRVLFAIPWHRHLVIGTTDTPVREVSPEPRPLDAEIDFLLEHAAQYLTRPPQRADVLGAWAGLRPLVKSVSAKAAHTSQLARDHTIVVSPSGLVTITGGKWTTYRAMAEDAVDIAARVAGLETRPCRTARLRLREDERGVDSSFEKRGNEAALSGEMKAPSEPDERLHPALPYRVCDVTHAARGEMARTLEDVLARRTRALFLNAWASMEIAPRVARLLARELGRDENWERDQIERFLSTARTYLPQVRPRVGDSP